MHTAPNELYTLVLWK